MRAYALADNKLSDLSSFDYGIVLETVETIILDYTHNGYHGQGVETAEIVMKVVATRTAELNVLTMRRTPYPRWTRSVG